MSIKKLFGRPDKSTQYVSEKNTKDAFEAVESERNLQQIRTKQKHFVPPVDYSDPIAFARYGSAYLYYKAAVERILNFYPYDGSDAELNEFYNKSLEIEKYIFDNVYPRLNGYATLSPVGWGTAQTAPAAANFYYGAPENEQFIEFKGGPHTASSTTLAGMSPNPYNSNYKISNVYDTNIYQTEGFPSNYGVGTRESNLKSNFDTGVTVEFWLKTGSLDASTQTQKQIVVDIWNNNGIASPPTADNHDYGRITLELNGTASTGTSPFMLTVQSGATAGIFQETIGTNFVTTDTLGSWHHYAFTIYNSGSSDLGYEFYLDGVYRTSSIFTGESLGELPSKNMIGRIGSLCRAPKATAAVSGSGKLTGSLDEFRFWKERRNAQDIGRHWFTQVRGGTNSDISNTTLGIYYKFNEGETGNSNTDSYIVDYSGRISNGMWKNYTSSVGARVDESAMVIAGATTGEYKDPIIRSSNPEVTRVKDSLLASGSYHDSNNNTSFLSMVPSWVIEEHENEPNEVNDLTMISHIAGVYLDNLYLQISSLSKLKSPTYTSSSHKPIPFAQHLPQSLGLYTPDLFVDASLLERFLNRKEDSKFEGDLFDAKNLIYLNLYKNLTHIYKSKGTEKAIRNVFRCFNIDESLMRLNVYAAGTTYELNNNTRQTLINKTSLNFNNSATTGAVVYQRTNPLNGDTSGFISGSMISSSAGALWPDPASLAGTPGQVEGVEDNYGFTAEVDVTFPEINPNRDKFTRNYSEVSLFGVLSASAELASDDPNYTTWFDNDASNFGVSVVKHPRNPRAAYFKITSSLGQVPFPLLTSSYISNLYDNQRWSVSVRLQPPFYPLTSYVSGAIARSDTDYTLIFEGLNTEIGTVHQKFTLTASVSPSASHGFLRATKRLYVGARRTNVTGAVIDPCDVYVGGTRYWAKYLNEVSLEQHMLDVENHGISGSYRNISAIEPSNSPTHGIGQDMLNLNTLALDWNFDNVTGSSAAGNFVVTDISSGSTEIRDNRGWLGKISGYQHSGYGHGFPASSTTVVERKADNSYKFTDPELAVSSDMIQILDSDDMVFGSQELLQRTLPNYFYVLEKSMYAAISEEMLTFFAGVVDFNNLIGAPVNRYRGRYKSLEKLREIFFRKVTAVADVEKYIDYYKWFDDALSDIVQQLVPASADFLPDVTNTVESHVLERNKYHNKFPTLEFKQPDLNIALEGMDLGLTAYDTAHGSPTYKHKIFWKRKADPARPQITSGDPTIDTQRLNLRTVGYSHPRLSQSVPTLFTVGGLAYRRNTFARRNFQNLAQLTIYDPLGTGSAAVLGGVNFRQNKNILFTYNALYPAGPVNRTGGLFIPRNVLLAQSTDIVPVEEAIDYITPPNTKVKRYFKLEHGRDWQDGQGYASGKSSFAWPFNVVSSSVTTGYNAIVSERVTGNFGNIEIVNLHNDVYNPNWEIPMQGPFTDYAVGGHQSRHVAINVSSSDPKRSIYHFHGLDNYLTRPEAWKLLVGCCPSAPGAIGMVGADYPWPEANEVGENPYPMTGAQKAVFYREEMAKRPVNIRNIPIQTGTMTTLLGNYRANYDIINTVGAHSNPRRFVEYQPKLPGVITSSIGAGATSVQLGDLTQIDNFLGLRRGEGYHYEFNLTASGPMELTGSPNKSIIRSTFAAPGGIEVMTRGYQDFRSGEFSVYNSINNKNHSVIKPFQPANVSMSATPHLQGGPGIRASDIHGLDYGLRPQLVRHTARFGRDSLWISGTTAVLDGPLDTAGGPGASQYQRPGFHKVHRNNTCDVKCTPSLQWTAAIAGYCANHDCNLKGIKYPIGSAAPGAGLLLQGHNTMDLYIPDSTNADTKFTYAFWIYPEYGLNNRGSNGSGDPEYPLLTMGYCEHLHRSLDFRLVSGDYDKAYLKIYMPTETQGAYSLSIWQNNYDVDDASTMVNLRKWNHVAFSYHTGSNDMINTLPDMYINGVKQLITTVNSPPAGEYATIAELTGTVNHSSRYPPEGATTTSVTAPILLGGNNLSGSGLDSYCVSGALDELAMFGGKLLDADITTLYNGGCYFNVTGALDTFFDAEGTLCPQNGWFRMGDGLLQVNRPADSGSLSGGDPDNWAVVFYNIDPVEMGEGVGQQHAFRLLGNDYGPGTKSAFITADLEWALYGDANPPLACTEGDIPGYFTEVEECATGSQYDNFYVQHQIPRASRQYRWIGSSLFETGNVRYCRFPTLHGPQSNLYSSSAGWDSFFGFVSASGFVSYGTDNTAYPGQRWGWPQSDGAAITLSPTSQRRTIPTVRGINLNVHEPITASTNTIGHASIVPLVEGKALSDAKPTQYLNRSLVQSVYTDGTTGDQLPGGGPAGPIGGSEVFNALMQYRDGAFGWASWQQARHHYHPIVRNEVRNNVVTVVTSSTGQIDTFRLPPVSMRGRTALASFTTSDGPLTLKMTSNNERIFFNQTRMNNLANKKPNSIVTPLDQGMQIGGLNWLAYTENVYPSARNEFTSHSLSRQGYDMAHGGVRWRDNYDERYDKGCELPNSFNHLMSQSCWPLSAPTNFMTRTGAVDITRGVWYRAALLRRGIHTPGMINKYNTAGELQSSYQAYISHSAELTAFTHVSLASRGWAGSQANIIYQPGALYARKHMLDTPDSVVSNSGIDIPETGSVMGAGLAIHNICGNFLPGAQLINQDYAWGKQKFNAAFAGESAWEAPQLAGIMIKSGSEYIFESHPSEPWFDTYNDFRYDIKTIAKDYSIIPEFRISEHIEDYLKNGIGDRSKFDTFEIPGTDITSATSSFYVDYSNSEFMKQFLKVNRKSGLNATEIKLICSASIRFHPYKGFYPAQRTLDLVEQFNKSYGPGLVGWNKYITSSVTAGGVPQSPRRLYISNNSVNMAATMDPLTEYDSIHRSEFYWGGKMNSSGSILPLMQPLFSPGILYNSIKSGLAVDWPIISSPGKVHFAWYASGSTGAGNSGASTAANYKFATGDTNNWALSCDMTASTANWIFGTASSMSIPTEPFSPIVNGPTNTGSLTLDQNLQNRWFTGEYWDQRLPFETIIEPSKHIRSIKFYNMEAHPSCSTAQTYLDHYADAQQYKQWIPTASWNGTLGDQLYDMMASNFAGAIPNFFLRGRQFTKLRSGVISSGRRFKTGSIYGCEVKLRRSMVGPRTYVLDSGSQGDNLGFAPDGANAVTSSLIDLVGGYVPDYGSLSAALQYKNSSIAGLENKTLRDIWGVVSGASYPIPQDPKQMGKAYRESFTMYSRPTAFGPDISCRKRLRNTSQYLAGNGEDPIDKHVDQHMSYDTGGDQIGRFGIRDSFNGFNPSFTPPYYDGEAWCHILFKPRADKEYSIEDVLAELEMVYWRFDPGPQVAVATTIGFNSNTMTMPYDHALISNGSGSFIYGGSNINANAMQLSASINLLGIERIPKQEQDKFGNLQKSSNEFAGARWVIQPKFETPMANFNPEGTRGISALSGTLALPANFGSASVTRGMWHQFGTLPTDQNTGIFLEIDDIPKPWLKYHHNIVNAQFTHPPGRTFSTAVLLPFAPAGAPSHGVCYHPAYSPYNTYKGGDCEAVWSQSRQKASQMVHKEMKSLVDLFGFKKKSKRLGEIANKKKIREAVVMVPYVVDAISDPKTQRNILRKKFIEIPMQRYAAAIREAQGSLKGDSLDTAGASIRKLAQKMKRYVLPPQFDFINNPAVNPIVMYMFEFSYELDKDDLSYIWQNLAPRSYKTVSLETRSITHGLMDLELMSEANLLDNQNLRWMVFKVKQRAMDEYKNEVVDQVAQSTSQMFFLPIIKFNILKDLSDNVSNDTYKLNYNWPYDYISFVETVKIDAQVLYTKADTANNKNSMKVEYDPGTEEIQVIKKKIILNPNPKMATNPFGFSPFKK